MDGSSAVFVSNQFAIAAHFAAGSHLRPQTTYSNALILLVHGERPVHYLWNIDIEPANESMSAGSTALLVLREALARGILDHHCRFQRVSGEQTRGGCISRWAWCKSPHVHYHVA